MYSEHSKDKQDTVVDFQTARHRKYADDNVLTNSTAIGQEYSTTYPEKGSKSIRPILESMKEESQRIERESIMDNNKILELYMDKVDKDQRDLKEDMRESERRTQKRIEESDKRLDEKMMQITEMIREQNRQIEKVSDKIEGVSENVSDKLEDYRKSMWGITISIFLAIAAMILTIILA